MFERWLVQLRAQWKYTRKRKRKTSNSISRPETQTDLVQEVPKAEDHKVSAHLEEEISQFAVSFCMESARILLLIIGILLSVPNTKQKEDCKFGEQCSFTHHEDKNSQGKKHKKDAKTRQGNNRPEKRHWQVEMYFSEHRISTWRWIYGCETIFLEAEQYEVFQKTISRCGSAKTPRNLLKIRDREGPSLGVIQGGSRNDRNHHASVYEERDTNCTDWREEHTRKQAQQTWNLLREHR